MKIPLLPDIDLARIAPMEQALKQKPLEQIRYGYAPFSYNPFRSTLADIFNIQPPMFGATKQTDWAKIESVLSRKCRSDGEFRANQCVAKGLHTFAQETKLFGRRQEFFPLAMGEGRHVIYWLPMILSLDDRPTVPFIDPRRSRGLTREGRRFAFSMMHERIRASDPDYSEVRFAIVQFKDDSEKQRHPVIYTDEGIELFSREDMEVMVSSTYELWREICEEREVDERRKSTGTRGSLI